jgi:hypothetical protein
MEISIASWNLCGLGKLKRWPSTSAWLSGHDIFFIQESLQVNPSYPFNDVTRFDVLAVPGGIRARGGLVIALQNRLFGAARITKVLEEEYLLALQVELPGVHASLLLVNVYAPVFTKNFGPDIIATIRDQLLLLAEQFPSSTVIIAGTTIERSAYLFFTKI